jgi:hypothetical protein
MYNLSPFDQPYNIVAAICLYTVLEKEAKSFSLEKHLNWIAQINQRTKQYEFDSYIYNKLA